MACPRHRFRASDPERIYDVAVRSELAALVQGCARLSPVGEHGHRAPFEARGLHGEPGAVEGAPGEKRILTRRAMEDGDCRRAVGLGVFARQWRCDTELVEDTEQRTEYDA